MVVLGQSIRFKDMDSAQSFAAQCGGHYVSDPDVHADIDLGNGRSLRRLRFIQDPIRPMQIPSSAR